MEAEDRQSYFRRRAREARALAEDATDDRVRTIHLEMAVRYELRAAEPSAAGVDDGVDDDRD